jgi:hypothetical protein
MLLRRIEGVEMKLHAALFSALDGGISFTLYPKNYLLVLISFLGIFGSRTRDFPACSALPQPIRTEFAP